MATDSLSSEMDKIDVEGKRNPTCARAPNLRPNVLCCVSSKPASPLLNLVNIVIAFFKPLAMHLIWRPIGKIQGKNFNRSRIIPHVKFLKIHTLQTIKLKYFCFRFIKIISLCTNARTKYQYSFFPLNSWKYVEVL